MSSTPIPIFVFGHQNPDTDSSVSAVVAAQLKAELNPGQVYQPLLLGEANSQTRWLFAEADVALPPVRRNLRYTVGELMVPATATHAMGVTHHLGEAMDEMQKHQLSLIPVIDDDYRLLGILSNRLPQNQYFFGFNIEDFLGVLLDIDDLASALPLERIRQGITLAAEKASRLIFFSHDPEDIEGRIGTSDIVIVGPSRRAIERLVQRGVRAIIVAEVDEVFCEKLMGLPGETPVYRYRGTLLALASQLSRAIQVGNVMTIEHATLRPDELVVDVMELVGSTPYPLPVLDPAGKLLGIFSRREALDQKPRPVILVDHVERSQSIAGFEIAEIVEIIDHHRLSDVRTHNPVRIDCRPIGSTASIVAAQFRENGLTPTQAQAKLLLGALVSDTLLLTSPTTTPLDQNLAEWLAGLAQVSLKDWGRNVLAQNDELAEGDPEKLVMKDCKEFTQGDCSFRVAAIETTSLALLTDERRTLLQKAAESIRGSTGAAFLVLMVTDVLQGESRLLIADPNSKRARHLLQVENLTEGKFAPGWVSRKKQLLPYLLRQVDTFRA